MSNFAPLLETFFTDRLAQQRRASPHTIAAYRDTFRLLLGFVQKRLGKAPSNLDLQDLDAPLIGAFLEYLEKERHNSVRTRNARLAAIHSLYRYAALLEPNHAALIQRVLAIPQKRFDRALVAFLEPHEVEALLAAPDGQTWIGRRDRTLLLLAVETGLRVSELIQLTPQDVQLGTGPHVHCLGKGRKERCTPLTTQTVTALRAWLQESQPQPSEPLFPSRRGGKLSRDAIEQLIKKYTAKAQGNCPSLRGKRISPHVLRHTNAMKLLRAGNEQTVIALWLGHECVESTKMYVHADMSIKERAIARTAPTQAPEPSRYRPPDALLAFLEQL